MSALRIAIPTFRLSLLGFVFANFFATTVTHAQAEPDLYVDPWDRALHLDVVDPETGRPAVIVPQAPWIRPGPDGVYGTVDDLVIPEIRGDVDLVVRSGHLTVEDTIPEPAPAGDSLFVGVAEPFNQGVPIPFSVIPSDGVGAAPAGSPTEPPYLEGLPVMAVAFADLDGDGYIGITLLDGDPTDGAIEQAELVPVGRRYAIAANGVAKEEIGVTLGGPSAAPARIALTASTFAGPFDEDYYRGMIPNGPAIMTRLPFLPETLPLVTVRQGLFGLKSADPNGRIAVDVQMAMQPDPTDPRIGESFTLRLDGSDPTIDVALVKSGAPSHIGVARVPDPSSYAPIGALPLKPGLDDEGKPALYEILPLLAIPDDGAGSPTRFRLVMLDRLENITDPTEPTTLRLRTRGRVAITEPDRDGDPFAERVLLEDARGIEVELDDLGGAYDAVGSDRLVIHAQGRPTSIELVLADPDFDGSGVVDKRDRDALEACTGSQLGDLFFNPEIDLDGNGVIDLADHQLFDASLGSGVVGDALTKRKKLKIRGWKKGKAHRPDDAREIKELKEEEKRRKKALKYAWKKSKLRERYCYWKAPK